jgi:hypothetical protein
LGFVNDFFEIERFSRGLSHSVQSLCGCLAMDRGQRYYVRSSDWNG